MQDRAGYLAYSVAAGIAGIRGGQWDAGLSLGLPRLHVLRWIGLPRLHVLRWIVLPRLHVLRWIVLPQALQMMQPSFVNQWVTLIKDSSLPYGVGELSFVASQVNSRLMIYSMEIFMFVDAIYFVLCSAQEQFAAWVARYFHPEALGARHVRRAVKKEQENTLPEALPEIA